MNEIVKEAMQHTATVEEKNGLKDVSYGNLFASVVNCNPEFATLYMNLPTRDSIDASQLTPTQIMDITIEKWILIYLLHKEHGVKKVDITGSVTCACCCAFYTYGITGCDPCPIKQYTGQSACNDTPFSDYETHHHIDYKIKYAAGMVETLVKVKRWMLLPGNFELIDSPFVRVLKEA